MGLTLLSLSLVVAIIALTPKVSARQLTLKAVLSTIVGWGMMVLFSIYLAAVAVSIIEPHDLKEVTRDLYAVVSSII